MKSVGFVLVSQARSGSTMLGSALGRHPQIAMHGEVFGNNHYPLNFYGIDESLPWPTPIEIVLKRIRDDEPIKFIEHFLLAKTARTRIGFKFKFEEFDAWPVVVTYIRTSKLPIILLERKDARARYQSEVSARITGRFNSTDNAEYGGAAEEAGQSFSEELISTALLTNEKLYRDAHILFNESPILHISFEQLISNWTGATDKVCDFLEITKVQLDPLTKRQPAASQ